MNGVARSDHPSRPGWDRPDERSDRSRKFRVRCVVCDAHSRAVTDAERFPDSRDARLRTVRDGGDGSGVRRRIGDAERGGRELQGRRRRNSLRRLRRCSSAPDKTERRDGELHQLFQDATHGVRFRREQLCARRHPARFARWSPGRKTPARTGRGGRYRPRKTCRHSLATIRT